MGRIADDFVLSPRFKGAVGGIGIMSSQAYPEGPQELVVALGIEKVNPMPPLKPLGDITRLEAYWYQVNRAFGLFVSTIQRPIEFLLHIARLGERASGQARQDITARPQRLTNLTIPVLTR